MKRYLLCSLAIAIAILSSAFTKGPTASITFEIGWWVDLTSSAEITDKNNWLETIWTCFPGDDIPCTITVNDAFTHLEGTAPNQYRVLNTTTQQGSVITIVSENGFLDTAPNPDVQYKRVATGTNYTFINQEFE